MELILLPVQADLLGPTAGLWRARERALQRAARPAQRRVGGRGLSRRQRLHLNHDYPLYPPPSELCCTSTCLTCSYLCCKQTDGMVMSSLVGYCCVITGLEASSQNLNESLIVGQYSVHLHIGVYKYKRVFKCFNAQLLKMRHCQPQTAASPALVGHELT